MPSSLQTARKKAAKQLLRAHGIPFVGTTRGLAAALKAAGLVPEEARPGKALNNALVHSGRVDRRGLLPANAVAHFYQSRAWMKLAADCKRRDGRRCMKCGATPDDGVRIVSDHIVPVRQRWDLRLDPSNIQTLCDPCNWQKGSLDCTDYRMEGADG